MRDSLIPSFLLSNVSKSLRLLTKNEGMSELLVFCSFAHFWAKNERFARKTNERIPSPAGQPGCSYHQMLSSSPHALLITSQPC